MPTVIDNLVLSLNLNTKGWTAAQRQALSDLRKFQSEAERAAKKSEEEGQRQAKWMANLKREAVTLFATLAGGYGVKQLVSNLVQGDAAVGRFSRTTGIAVEKVADFENAVLRAGGQAGSGTGALGALNEQIQQFNKGNNANLAGIYNQIAAEGVRVIKINDDIIKQLADLAHNAQMIEKRSPGRGAGYLRDLGFNEDAINLLVQGEKHLREQLRISRELGAANKENADASEKLLSKWRDTSSLIQGLLRPMMLVAEQVLDGVNKQLEQAIKNQKTFYETKGQDREDLRNSRINYALGVSKETQESWQEWFPKTWLGQALGVKPLEKAGEAPAGYSGGITGGTGWKIQGWETGDYPRFPAPATYGAGARGGGGGGGGGEVNVGPITMNIQANDANAVADGLATAVQTKMRQRQLATQAISGQQ